MGKYLSDVIKFDKDILPYRIIQITAGVGSGKNHWANTLAQKNHVLYITSRKATANAEADRVGAKRWIDLEELSEKTWGEFKKNPTICTNSGIMKFIKERYDDGNADTHIWNFLDYIVLDEAHSLAADAVFSDAPFYVERFVKYAVHKNPKLRLIIMTGTPSPVEWLIPEKHKNSSQFNMLDYSTICTNVSPKTVHFISAKDAEKRLNKLLDAGEKAIYFVSSIGNMKNIMERKIAGHIAEEKIGVAFAKKEREGDFDPTFIKHQKEEVATYLRENDKLPEHIQLFLTTTQNKEGVNIKNDDIHVMFVESDSVDEITQMAGRVRKGLDTLYVIADNARQPNGVETMLGIHIDEAFLEHVNSGYNDFIAKYPNQKNDAIKELERRFPYIRYDTLYEKKFVRYDGRVHGDIQRISDRSNLLRALDGYLAFGASTAGSVKLELEKMFPNSTILYTPSKSKTERWAAAKVAVKDLLDTKTWMGTKLPNSDQSAILEEINKVFEAEGLKHDYKRLGDALKKAGCKKETAGTKKTGKGHFIITAT